jgi:hypothetical protein
MVAVGARLWRKGEFGTTVWDRRLAAMFRGVPARPPGTATAPEVLLLEPEPGTTPSPKPPVRIFLGTEPAQARAERVFVWSVLRVRDPSRRYEVHVMRDLEGFERRLWKTGFTNYRYAIPHLAGGSGRAIYNDVDQVYLADPAELFDADMGGKAVLSIDERETSVMLLDCAKLVPLWPLVDARTVASHKQFRTRVTDAGLWGRMSPFWNSRDHEYRPDRSKLLHFTILHKQPWRPFPDELRYRPHELAPLWLGLEREADAAGFELSRLPRRPGRPAAEGQSDGARYTRGPGP